MKAAILFGLCLSLAPPSWSLQAAPAASSPEDAQAKRERVLKMPEIIAALGLKEGFKVADIGAGDGYYEIPMSRVVGPKGRVYAEDIDKGPIQRLHERADELHLGNVEVIQGLPDDPKLPDGALDAVLTVIAYHEIENYRSVLDHVLAALRPGGRFVVVDMMPQKTASRPRADQTKNHVIAADFAEAEVRQAGFDVVSRDDHFIDRPDEETTRWMIVFQKPAGRQ